MLHLAGLSRLMSLHSENINRSIDLNIIGTANIVKACNEKKIKIIFFHQTMFILGKKVIIKKKIQFYLGITMVGQNLGLKTVQMYKNSLIIRACMTEKPFTHKSAFTNVKTNFIFHDEFAKLLIKVIPFKGIINIGGKTQSIYNFAKKYNRNINKKKSMGQLPQNIFMNLAKLNTLIKL